MLRAQTEAKPDTEQQHAVYGATALCCRVGCKLRKIDEGASYIQEQFVIYLCFCSLILVVGCEEGGGGKAHAL